MGMTALYIFQLPRCATFSIRQPELCARTIYGIIWPIYAFCVDHSLIQP